MATLLKLAAKQPKAPAYVRRLLAAASRRSNDGRPTSR